MPRCIRHLVVEPEFLETVKRLYGERLGHANCLYLCVIYILFYHLILHGILGRITHFGVHSYCEAFAATTSAAAARRCAATTSAATNRLDYLVFNRYCSIGYADQLDFHLVVKKIQGICIQNVICLITLK